ncbi:hypothetical protein ACLOJK_008315 [Asimina triloba]
MCSSTTCGRSDIVVTQTITMKLVLGKPEFLVEVNNMCSCPQANIRLACHGFQTVETPDPAILRKEDRGSICLVNSGRPVLPHNTVSFAYAWDKPTEFALASASPECPPGMNID